MEYTLNFDGACTPNPGVRRADWQIEDKYGVFYHCWYNFLCESTNNFIEYSALIARKVVLKEDRPSKIRIWGDRKLVIS